jgi:hypothetical protein
METETVRPQMGRPADPNREEQRVMVIQVPLSMHTRTKDRCRQKGESMAGYVRRLIREDEARQEERVA